MKKCIDFTLFIFCTLILLFTLWFISPFYKFGVAVAIDAFSPHNSGKANVEKYIKSQYKESVEIIDYTYEGELRRDVMSTLVHEKKTNKEYTIYYDLKRNEILLDEYQFNKHLKGMPSLPLPKVDIQGGTKEKSLLKYIQTQQNLIFLYERVLASEMLKQTSIDLIENEKLSENELTKLRNILEGEYTKLGIMLNDLDAIRDGRIDG